MNYSFPLNIPLALTLFVLLLSFLPALLNAQCPGCSDCSPQKNNSSALTKNESPQKETSDTKKSADSGSQKTNNSSEAEDILDEFGDEFEEFEEFDEKDDSAAVKTSEDDGQTTDYSFWDKISLSVYALIATIIAGIFFRFAFTRKFRYVFLIGSAIWLGFITGACPCPISSLSYTIIGISGGAIFWGAAIWFLGLIPITYVFGKVWCGWVCHLGAMQEFLNKPGKFDFLSGAKAQFVMRILRWILLAVLIVQLLYTNTYLFNKIDPFRVAYNLGFGSNLTSWILLGLLLLSSVFIHRPFCKAACPIGLILGWVTRIPGAAVLGPKPGECTGCRVCNQSCGMDAIVIKEKNSILHNTDCIACGECLDACKKGALDHFRMSKDHPSTVLCGKESNNCSVN